MDPWLESPAIFPDLHNTLITYLGDALNAVLPEPYFARSATRVWVEQGHPREPDVSLLDPSMRPVRPSAVDLAAAMTAAGLIAVDAPAVVPEPFEEPFLEVRSTSDDRLVTAIEVSSIANKSPGDKGREAYRQKQAEYLTEGVGLVEIDLLRGGEHTTAVPRGRLRSRAGFFAYHVCVSGAVLGRQHFIAPIRLADRLPPISVPLDRDMEPVKVELQPLLNQCYDNRRYARQVRYTQPPDPPLTDEQRLWAAGILRQKGLLP
jgi:hypothetical protein